MINRFKFRFWSKTKNEFTNPFIWCGGDGTLCMNNGEGEDFIPSQFTGLKDNNGKDVYEGDVVEFKGHFIATVIWCEEDAAFQIRSENGAGAFLNENYILNFEVIGNIYENPELLK